MNETEIAKEAELETIKSTEELIKDSIREANTLPKSPASERNNLDIIKHLIKRLAIHQIILEEKANKTNIFLLWLSVVIAIGAIFSILIFFK